MKEPNYIAWEDSRRTYVNIVIFPYFNKILSWTLDNLEFNKFLIKYKISQFVLGSLSDSK